MKVALIKTSFVNNTNGIRRGFGRLVLGIFSSPSVRDCGSGLRGWSAELSGGSSWLRSARGW